MRLLLVILAILAWADPALAQSVTLDFGDEGGGSVTARIFQLMLLVTVLSVAPGILVMVTSFTRIVVVLAFLRTALGLQTTPPNTVLVSLALFLTLFVMAPVFERSYEDGIRPLLNEEMEEREALERAAAHVHEVMRAHVRDNAWGHHACGTCAMKPRSQGGVVDSRFRVHGVDGLRVVDASVFPRIPGYFLVSSVYMIAEKAADTILADLRTDAGATRVAAEQGGMRRQWRAT